MHFATHGLLAGETEALAPSKAEPALLLTPPQQATTEDDGLLTASEVAQLKLDPDWVVLSACNTAQRRQAGRGGTIRPRASLFAMRVCGRYLCRIGRQFRCDGEAHNESIRRAESQPGLGSVRSVAPFNAGASRHGRLRPPRSLGTGRQLIDKN